MLLLDNVGVLNTCVTGKSRVLQPKVASWLIVNMLLGTAHGQHHHGNTERTVSAIASSNNILSCNTKTHATQKQITVLHSHYSLLSKTHPQKQLECKL